MCKAKVKYAGAKLQKQNIKLHTEMQRRLRQLHPATVYVTLREHCTKLFLIFLLLLQPTNAQLIPQKCIPQ